MLYPPKKKAEDKADAEDDQDYEDPSPMPAYSQSEWRECKTQCRSVERAEEFDKKLLSIENKFVSPALLNSGDKYFVEPYKL